MIRNMLLNICQTKSIQKDKWYICAKLLMTSPRWTYAIPVYTNNTFLEAWSPKITQKQHVEVPNPIDKNSASRINISSCMLMCLRLSMPWKVMSSMALGPYIWSGEAKPFPSTRSRVLCWVNLSGSVEKFKTSKIAFVDRASTTHVFIEDRKNLV